MEIREKTAVVTGAAHGIGAAIAGRLVRAGARVAVGDVDGDGAHAVAERLNATTPDAAIAVTADASTTAGITEMIAATVAAFGPVDMYVANAGIFGAPGLGGSDADWFRAIDINLMAHVRAAEILVPQWIARGGGYFVSTASAAGLLTQIGMGPYSVTKHAAVGFAEWLAISYGDQGVGVSCLCPMGVATDILSEAEDGPLQDLAVRSVTGAGAVLEATDVADVLIDAIEQDRFLVLPHPAVHTMFRNRAEDTDRWIAGMRAYQARIEKETA